METEGKSLDPRVNRLDIKEWDSDLSKESMDQLETYEVFVQPREGRPMIHEGIIHAFDEEMAFVFAKEQFGRRGTCIGMGIVRSDKVIVSDMSDGGRNVYDTIIESETSSPSELKNYKVFHLFKRGKQHTYAGSVKAGSDDAAFYMAKQNLDPGNPAKPVLNIRMVKTNDFFTSEEEDKMLWFTTPEKTFREALDYKGADRIKKYKATK